VSKMAFVIKYHEKSRLPSKRRGTATPKWYFVLISNRYWETGRPRAIKFLFVVCETGQLPQDRRSLPNSERCGATSFASVQSSLAKKTKQIIHHGPFSVFPPH
jgi:hypothetical protein